MDQMFAKWGGGEVLRRAVKGMLPKNRLQDSRLARLKSKFVVDEVTYFEMDDHLPPLHLLTIIQLLKVSSTLTRTILSSSVITR